MRLIKSDWGPDTDKNGQAAGDNFSSRRSRAQMTGLVIPFTPLLITVLFLQHIFCPFLFFALSWWQKDRNIWNNCSASVKVVCTALAMWLWAISESSKQTDNLWTECCANRQHETRLLNQSSQQLNDAKATGPLRTVIPLVTVQYSKDARSSVLLFFFHTLVHTLCNNCPSDGQISFIFTESYSDTHSVCVRIRVSASAA